MAIYLDSASVEHAREAQLLGFVTAITTNPSLMAQEIEGTGQRPLDVLHDLVATFKGPIWFQIYGETVEERSQLAFEASQVSPHQVIIKIPATTDNLTIASRLTSLNIPCAFTGVYSTAQVYMVEQTGALFAAPYVNRMTRFLGDGLSILREMRTLIDKNGLNVQLVAASLKSTEEVTAALLAGAHHVTIPLELIRQMAEHDLTQQAVAEFDEALQRALPSDILEEF